MTTHALLLEYLSAYNNHDINKIISFLHPDCRVIFNGEVVLQGIDAMRPTYEHDFLNPQANTTVVKYHEETNDQDQDRIRVVLKIHDTRLLDVTYVFESNEDGAEISRKRMIEHIIHSLQSAQDS